MRPAARASHIFRFNDLGSGLLLKAMVSDVQTQVMSGVWQGRESLCPTAAGVPAATKPGLARANNGLLFQLWPTANFGFHAAMSNPHDTGRPWSNQVPGKPSFS
jgi:hypothetical protein